MRLLVDHRYRGHIESPPMRYFPEEAVGNLIQYYISGCWTCHPLPSLCLYRRSIAASYSHVQVQSTIDAAKLAAQINSGVDDEALLNGGKRARVGAGGLDAMAAMEAEALQAEAAAQAAPSRAALPGFVSAGVIQQGKDSGQAAAAKEAAAQAAMHNPEEIDIDATGMDEDEEGADGAEEVGAVEVDRAEVQTKAVPSAVFGSLAAKVAAEQEAAGALDRFKKRRVQ